MKQAPCTPDLLVAVKTIMLIRQWYKKRNVNLLCERQEIAVTNRRKAIEDAHMMTAVVETPSRYWLEYSFGITQDGYVTVLVKQSGELPDVLQDDTETTIHLSVSVKSETKDVCLVHHGKQLQPPETVFEDVNIDGRNKQLKVMFEVYFVTGRVIKKKHPITAWTVTEDWTSLREQIHSRWKLIEKLSS